MASLKVFAVYWTCAVRECTAKATTNNRILTKHTDDHIHPADHIGLDVRKVMLNIKKRCREELTPIPSIYREETTLMKNRNWNEETAAVAEKIPTYQSCKTALYSERSKLHPTLPKSAADILLEDEWRQTTSGENFLLIDEGGHNRMLVFATRASLQHLCATRVLYGDGTFYTCPKQFHQLFSLHGFVDGEMYPLVFAFLPGNSASVYETFLERLKQKCEEIDLDLRPDTVFLDHGVASRIAVQRVFPDSEVKACFFHFTQCIWRKVQSLGLATTYRRNDAVHRLVRRASALPLVPATEVEDVWFQALTDIGEEDLPVDVTPFTDYVTEQWVEGNRDIWNHFGTQGPRTTNHLEGWHSMLKKAVRHAHPNIFDIVKVLQQIETSSCIQMLQYQAGGVRPTKRRKYRQLEERLQRLKTRYVAGEIGIMVYVDEASHLLHL